MTSSDERAQNVRSKWWRFDRYEVVNGWIQAAPGARLEEYDPWGEYLEGKRARKDYQPPYVQLARISEVRGYGETALDFLDPPPEWRLRQGPLPEPDPELEPMVLQWFRENGALGHGHDLIRAVLKPHSGEPARFYQRSPEGGWESGIAGGWGSEEVFPPPGYGLYRRATLFDKDDAAEGGGWTLREWWSSDADPPESPAFWRSLQEHYFTFLEEARTIAATLFKLRMLAGGNDPESIVDDYYQAHVGLEDHYCDWDNEMERTFTLAHVEGRRTVQMMLAGVQPALTDAEEGGFAAVLNSPTLISTMGLMILEDLTGGARVKRCESCHKLMVGSPKRLYCSDTCKARAAKQRQRSDPAYHDAEMQRQRERRAAERQARTPRPSRKSGQSGTPRKEPS